MHEEHGFEGYALLHLGDAVAAGQDADLPRAEQLYQQALAIAEEVGMRPLEANCHQSLGSLYRALGRLEEARTQLNLAVDLWLTMGHKPGLAAAEAEVAALDAPLVSR